MTRPPRGLGGRAVAYFAVRDLIPLCAVYALLFSDNGLSTAEISSLLVIWSVTAFVPGGPSGAWADAVSRRGLLVLQLIAVRRGPLAVDRRPVLCRLRRRVRALGCQWCADVRDVPGTAVRRTRGQQRRVALRPADGLGQLACHGGHGRRNRTGNSAVAMGGYTLSAGSTSASPWCRPFSRSPCRRPRTNEAGDSDLDRSHDIAGGVAAAMSSCCNPVCPRSCVIASSGTPY